MSDSEFSEDEEESGKWKYFITKQIIDDVKEFINMYQILIRDFYGEYLDV